MTRCSLPPIPYKLLVLIGPTASGKSELAVKLAKKFNGEIISCDSRQIYKGMDLGTGKIPGKRYSAVNHGRELYTNQIYLYKGVRHHLIDFLSPKRQYSAAQFQREVKNVIADVVQRGKLPILCGGTAHWIDAVVYNQQIPDVKPDLKLRAKLKKLPVNEIFNKLVLLDPTRAKTIGPHNKHRLIRALEIVTLTGKPVPILSPGHYSLPAHNTLWIGIRLPRQTLYQKIDRRLNQRLKAGLVKEIAQLHKQGLSWKRLESFGLEYKYVSLFLQKKLSRDEMLNQLSYAIKHYSKRQMTWWKRNKEIIWLNTLKQAETATKQFLK